MEVMELRSTEGDVAGELWHMVGRGACNVRRICICCVWAGEDVLTPGHSVLSPHRPQRTAAPRPPGRTPWQVAADWKSLRSRLVDYISKAKERRGSPATKRRRQRLRECVEAACPCCRRVPADLSTPEVQKPPPREAIIQEDDITRECLRSLGGFIFGIFFTTLYGFFVLFVQEYNLWYCLVSTITCAILLGLGMGLSAKIRINIFLMVPHIFTRQGRTFLLAVVFGLVLEGPLTNIITNFSRGSDTIACGQELAMNQTRELLLKAKQPLVAALDKIKNIASAAKGVGDRVRRFFRTLKKSIRHIVRILRNITSWLGRIGQICNQEMGQPFAKCMKIFDDAINRCFQLLGFLGFMCYLVNILKPLCGVVAIIQYFCIIPAIVQTQLKKHVVEPISDALDRLAAQFEFTIRIDHHFHIRGNQSRPVSHVALDIMEEIYQRVGVVYESIGLLGYLSTVMMLFLYIQSLLYRKNYLFRDDYDNYYITRQFLEVDIMRAKTGKETILPLSYQEACRYVWPCSLYLTRSERKQYILGFIRLLRHSVTALVIILLDYSIYWVLDMVSYHLKAEIIARSPMVMGISISGKGYASDIYRDMADSLDEVQSGNITVLSKKCNVVPSPPNFKIYRLIGGLYGVLFFIMLFGNYVSRLRRYICSVYYPSRERIRTCYLYNQIQTKRSSLMKELFRCVRKNSSDGGHTSILLVLAARFKVFAWIAALTGTYQEYCLACGRVMEGEESELFVPCITPGCKGIYCMECYQNMNNICSVCMGPLAFQGDIDEEIDSSDSSKVHLWMSAVDSLKSRLDKKKQDRKRMRELLKVRIRTALYEQHNVTPEKASALRKLFWEGRKGKKKKRRVTPSILPETQKPQRSELDFSYQDRSAVEATTSDEPYDPREFIEKRKGRNLVTVSELERLKEEQGHARRPVSSGTEDSQLSDVRVDTYSSPATDTTHTEAGSGWKSRLSTLRSFLPKLPTAGGVGKTPT